MVQSTSGANKFTLLFHDTCLALDQSVEQATYATVLLDKL
jgi:hypothetical protein